jgi:GMP synthase (glutamine-hydrolysing)
METILILDFGSQTTALIGRRIREIGVYCEIIPGDSALTPAVLTNVAGIILSGSPESVNNDGPTVDPAVYTCGLPLLGICYGLQRMTKDLGGTVEPLPKREFGRVLVKLDVKSAQSHTSKPNPAVVDFMLAFMGHDDRFLGFPFTHFHRKSASEFTAWFSHGDTLTSLAPGFVEVATSASGYPAMVYHTEKPWFGVQFHPEVTHTERGTDVLAAFALGVCKAPRAWTMERYLDEAVANIRKRAGDKPVLLLISGGVDSTVTAALLLRALGPMQVFLLYIDTGLMRKGETEEIRTNLKKLGAAHFAIINAAEEFFNALKGMTDPETKRKIIGDLFITIEEREVAGLALPAGYFLAQGTLYTDMVESGRGVGTKAHIIKTHHNVASPLIAAKRAAGRLIEPLDKLYKDEVRALGRLLELPASLVGRQPFPGPGLAVRVLGEVTPEKCRILREVDAIFIEELHRRHVRYGACARTLYEDIWQAFAVLLPVRSVGVAGDGRQYGYVVALRAVTSEDGMTADVYPFPVSDILEISSLITNAVPEVGRVTYDISSKPPATIEWE